MTKLLLEYSGYVVRLMLEDKPIAELILEENGPETFIDFEPGEQWVHRGKVAMTFGVHQIHGSLFEYVGDGQ
jgi:hypothetical protein